jgi:oligosaccharide repeat unit polymerase
MITLLASAWIPAIALSVLACVARLLSDSWLAPSSFAALLWSVFVWISMLATDYPIYASAVWVIVLFVSVLQLGAFIGQEIGGGRVGGIVRQDIETLNTGTPNTLVVRICVACTIVAFAGALYFISWSFRRFDLPASPTSFLVLGHLWSDQRYEYGELEPWPVRLTTMWTYPAALLGGIGFATAKNRMTKSWTLLPFLPALLVGSIVAARAGMLISLICWFSGYFSVRHWQYNGTYPLFRRRLVLLLAALGAVGLMLFLFADALRGLGYGEHTFELTLDPQRLLKYSLGSLAAFSSWFHHYKADHATFGAYTFGGIFDLLGLQHREIGLYGGSVTLPDGEETNIYTALRGLIEDFTLLGTVCLAFVMGFMSEMVLRNPSRRTETSILFTSAYYAFILCSPLTSVFTYNGLILAWVVGAFVLRSHFRSAGGRVYAGALAGSVLSRPS